MRYRKHLLAMAAALVVLAVAGILATRKSAESAISYSIGAGNFPQYMARSGQNIYVLNRFNSNVTVIDTNTHQVVQTISVGSNPVGDPIVVGTDLYVTNSGNGRVSVINTLTNTVSNTIIIGPSPSASPWGGYLVGTDIYITNVGSSTISVIDTVTKTVTNSIVTGLSNSDRSYGLVGTKLYVTNYNAGSVSVIDTVTKTVITTIPIGPSPVSLVAVGTKVYVAKQNSGNIAVIDSVTDTVATTIVTPQGSIEIFLVGTDLYTLHYGSPSIPIIDTLTDTLTSTIVTNVGGYSPNLIGTTLYLPNYIGDSVDVIDTVTQTLTTSIAVGDQPFFAEFGGDFLYVANTNSDDVSVIDTNTNTLVEVGKPLRQSASISGTELTITYDEPLDPASVPDVSRFTVRYTGIIGAIIPVNNVSVIGSTVVLQMASAADTLDDVRVSYSAPGVNPIQDVSQNTAISFTHYVTNVISCAAIEVQSNPFFSLATGGNLYVLNDDSNSVSVIDIGTSTVTDTITVGSQPRYAVLAGTSLYIMHHDSDEVMVIDTLTNTVTDTIIIDYGSSFGTLIGSDLYVITGDSSSVSVIDTLTNTVTDTIAVGDGSEFAVLNGTDLYVINADSSDVSVIDTLTNTVVDTISIGDSSFRAALVGTQLYVTNQGTNDVSVIDTLTNTVTDTILTDDGPRDIHAVGTDLFVVNEYLDSVSVIDTLTNTVTDTIVVGDSPRTSALVGTDLYVYIGNDSEMAIVDTVTKTVTKTFAIGSTPTSLTLVGSTLYTTQDPGVVRLIDTVSQDLNYCGVLYALSYTAGPFGSITGTAVQNVAENADGTPVTAVPNPGYRFTQWSDASTANPRTDTGVTANLSVTANFVTLANPGSGGSTGCVGQACGDTLAPEISAILVSDITTSSAVITWTTSEPATTAFYFGLNDGYGSGYRGSGNRVTSHSVTLTNLAEGAEYHFQLQAADERGNTAVTGDNVFSTLTTTQLLESLEISNINATFITETTAVINWQTNAPLNSRVDYGISDTYGNVATNDASTMSHTVNLSGLSPNSTYHYRVTSGFGTSTVGSGDFVFSTLVSVTPPTNPVDFAATGEEGRVRLTWTNPDEDDFSRVRVVSRPDRYPTNMSDGALVYEGDAESAYHSSLPPTQTQFYAIFAIDDIGGRSSGSISLATTLSAEPMEEPETPPEPVVPPVTPPTNPPTTPNPPTSPTTPTAPTNPTNPPTNPTTPSVTGLPVVPSTTPELVVPPVTAPDVVLLKPNEPTNPAQDLPIAQLAGIAPTTTVLQQISQWVEASPVSPEMAAAIATAATLASIASVANAFSYLGYLFSQPLMLIGARMRKKWGVVYNSITKQGTNLAVVRLIDAETGRVLQTKITDNLGRYFFHVKPGKYRLEASKADHVFPSAIASGLAEDDEYLDIYHGTPVTVESEMDLTMNIPLDPNHREEQDHVVLFKRFKTKMQYGISALSFGITAIALALQPSPALLGLLLLQVVTYLAFRKLVAVHKQKKWGVVTEEGSSKPLKNAIVRIFDKQYNKLLETQVTDSKGRYGFLANKNRYFVTADKQGYQRYISEEIDLTRAEAQTIERPIGLKKVEVVGDLPIQGPTMMNG